MRLQQRLAVLVAGAAVLVGGSLTTVPSVHAAAPAATPTTATVRADVLPAPQINGVVWKQVIAGNVAYAGGEFTQARPFGVAAGGAGSVTRSNLLAYNLTTGALDTSFAPTFDGRISDMAVTPDGSKLVVVGSFTQVNGQPRNRVAVFDLPSRTLSTTVVPDVNSAVDAVSTTNTTIFLAGGFSAINGVIRNRVGSVAASNGALQPLTVPVDNGSVNAILVSPDGSQIVIGGNFSSVGGSTDPGFGLYRANATSGAPLALPVNSTVRDAGDKSGILRLSGDATSFYGAGYAYHADGGTGNAEGFFQASWSDGSLVNLEDCHGDAYDVAPVGDVVYVASHHHYCGNSGGFPQTKPWSYWHSTAWTKSTQGTNTSDMYGYPDHPGTPRPGILPWFPKYQTGTYTGQGQATWSVTGNAQYVLFGGEFLKVNGIAQQGIVRFGVRSVAPNKSKPQQPVSGAWTPTAQSTTPGQVNVTWPAVWDRDDLTLTYRLFRNGTQVYQTSQSAFFWDGTAMSYTDMAQTPGSRPSYVVRAYDPDGNYTGSTSASVTVAGANGAKANVAGVPAPGAALALPHGRAHAGSAPRASSPSSPLSSLFGIP